MIINVFIWGGVNVGYDTVTASKVQFAALQYLFTKLFIHKKFAQIVTAKVVKITTQSTANYVFLQCRESNIISKINYYIKYKFYFGNNYYIYNKVYTKKESLGINQNSLP